jgi:hypothetical protein
VRELDVRWDGYSHEDIVQRVDIGPGAALTEFMEEHLRQAPQVLAELGDEIRQVIERTGDGWQGGAADAAGNAMWVLRNIDDGMHFTSNVSGIRAYGQSDNAAWVRTNMPPVVEVRPPVPTGMMIDVVQVTEDYHKQQAAAKNAEQRAREIMRKYTDATRERAAAMTPLAPVPQVVLEFAPDPGGRPSGGESPPPRPREPVAWSPGGEPPNGGGPAGPGSPPPVSRAAPPATESAAATPAAGGPPAVPSQSRGETRAATLPDKASGGPSIVRLGGGDAMPGQRAIQDAERGPSGRGTDELPGRREVVGRAPVNGAAPGTWGEATGAGGSGVEAPLGAGMGDRREENRGQPNRYSIPTAEHFEAGDPDADPNREGWHVAPDVIGEHDAGGGNR